MKKEDLEAFGREAAKTIKTPEDLNDFRAMLTKVTVEAALNAELDDHLGYDKNSKSDSENSRNGSSRKTLRTEDGQFELDTPRDRLGDFEPRIVKKHQTRFTSMDDKILFLYAQGMTNRETVSTFKELYGAGVSASLNSVIRKAIKKRKLFPSDDSVKKVIYLAI